LPKSPEEFVPENNYPTFCDEPDSNIGVGPFTE